jgi:acetolactate synthase-1/2/3 large subunit
MKASDYIAAELARRGVPAVFELVGGMITHLLDSLHKNGKVRIVSMHHEQGAAFAAEAAARISGIPGVAMATSGPGATNLLTGIGSCYFDSTPAVFITGQVNRHEQKGSRAVRQLGFQETDIVAMARPITKAAYLVNDVVTLPALLDEAFALAVSGRPGPVVLDIPMDVQREQVDVSDATVIATDVPAALLDLDAVRDALRLAERPMILAGGGIRGAQAAADFRRLVDALQVPVVHSLMGVDVLPYHHPLNVGMIGSYGNRWANLSLSRADFLLVLGSRLDVRQTGADTASFRGQRAIFHVDVEAGEMNNRVEGCHAILGHLKPALRQIASALEGAAQGQKPWVAEIAELRRQWPDTAELAGVPGINPNVLMHQVSRTFPGAGAYVVDVGQHQMWAAQSLELGDAQRFLTSGGMGSMGFGLPAAVGAAVALAGAPVVIIAGDGGFQCNIQELETIVRFDLPIKIIVVNNESHGMVRQFQESYFESRFQSTVWGYSAPSFRRVAEAYDIQARCISEVNQVAEAVNWLASDSGKPALLEVMISPKANAYPKLAFGHGLDSMEPQVKPLEMEGT